MKLFKYTALALAFAASITACSEKDDFTPGAPSDGVYFPTDDALEVELDRSIDYFEVIVARVGDNKEASYALTGAADTEVFTLPESVQFEQGAKSATVRVKYNAAEMAFDRPYSVMLAFGEGAAVSTYGYESLEMDVTLPAPWSTVGMGTFTDFWALPIYGITPEKYPELTNQWEVELQRNDIEPNRYRWKNPYGENFAKYCAANDIGTLEPQEYDSQNKYYIEFVLGSNGNAVVPYGQLSGATLNEEEGMIVVGTMGGYYYTNQGVSVDVIYANMPETVSHFDATPGKEIFSTPSGSSIVGLANDPDGPYVPNYNPGGYVWYAADVVISDYNVALKYNGVLTDPAGDSFVLASVSVGKDLSKVVVGLVATTDENEAYDAVRNGTVETVELTESTESLRFDFMGTADYTLAAIAYDAEGTEVQQQAITFFVSSGAAPKEWTKLGTGIMVDGWVLPMFKSGGVRVDPMQYAYQVEMEENIENPGIYRILQPWQTANYPIASLNKYSGDAVFNLVVDARDQDFVTVAPQFTGFVVEYSDGGTDALWATSIADFYKATGRNDYALQYANYVEDGEIIITFPTFGVTDTANDPQPAIKDCGYTFYGQNPYSPELKACPGIFALPDDAAKVKAKVAMKSLQNKAQLTYGKRTVASAIESWKASRKELRLERMQRAIVK